MALLMMLLSFHSSLNGTPLKRGLEEKAVLFSGEDYFTGIFFAQGPVAAVIPMYQKGLKVPSSPNLKTLNPILEGIRKKDARFFDNFLSAIESRNHVKIDRAIQDGGKLLMQVLQSIPEAKLVLDNVDISTAKASSFESSDGEIDYQKLEEYGESLKENILAKSGGDISPNSLISVWIAAVSVAVVVVLIFWGYGPDSGIYANTKSLKREVLVDQIANL